MKRIKRISRGMAKKILLQRILDKKSMPTHDEKIELVNDEGVIVLYPYSNLIKAAYFSPSAVPYSKLC